LFLRLISLFIKINAGKSNNTGRLLGLLSSCASVHPMFTSQYRHPQLQALDLKHLYKEQTV
jgi:hypothetical protein